MTVIAPDPGVTRVPARRPGVVRRIREGSAWITIVTIGVMVLAWELVPRLEGVNRILFPTFSDVAAGFVQLLGSGYWWEDLGKTMGAVAIAWAIGVSFGFAMGVLLGTSPFIRTAITPYAIAVQALPKVVLAPLLIGWLGFGPESKIALAVIICFFPVWIDTMVGLALPAANEFKLMQSLRASRTQVFLKLQLPSALPMIMVGVKHSLLLAFTGVLVAEILSASDGGLGKLAKEFASQLNMPLTYSVVLVVVVLAVVLVSVADVIERRVVFWSDEARARKR
ncbi:ABC transporter permease [Homoserinibacter sp. YIM 151385]|uniref:ABC transporter permease n=1 Tax=Homoserinibacter sp. YIM 151385 TaxID=2985506 RepID=UPI0022F03F0B|nr:ABC transporter permease [Homoserinibacter sp. YIM 151385]WBU37095.1 ABC transporter permease [Homoserinibacter sp. YIM 151385]